MTEEKRQHKPHNIIIQNRRHMTLTGVIRVDNFDDRAITLITEHGSLTVEGGNLHISKLLLETGDMIIDGMISALYYTEDNGEKGKPASIFSKLFK